MRNSVYARSHLPGHLYPWRWPVRPWQRIHIDFTEKDKQFFLVVIENHSKWLEVVPMSSITSSLTTDALQGFFAAYGIQEEVVSDNGPNLVSTEFTDFLKGNGIKIHEYLLITQPQMVLQRDLFRYLNTHSWKASAKNKISRCFHSSTNWQISC